MFDKKRTDVSAKRREIAKKITDIRISIEDLKTEDPCNAASYNKLSLQLESLITRLKSI